MSYRGSRGLTGKQGTGVREPRTGNREQKKQKQQSISHISHISQGLKPVCSEGDGIAQAKAWAYLRNNG